MAVPTLKSVLSYGNRKGKSPEELAADVQLWRSVVLKEGRELAKDDPERYWSGSDSVESSAQAALTGLNERIRQEILVKALPEPAEQKAFIDSLNEGKGQLPPDAPPLWQSVEDEIVKAGQDPRFQGAKGFSGKVAQGTNELGEYQVRQTPEGDFEALIKPPEGKPILRRLSVDRSALLKRDIEESAKLFQEAGRDGTAADKAVLARVAAEDPKALSFYYENAPDSAIVHNELVESLRKDQEFLKTIPENNIQQFTSRPARNVIAQLQNAGTGIYDLVTGGQTDASVFAGRQEYVDEQSPGRLRSRFETKGNPVGDMLSQGVESLTTLYGPGTVLKGLRLAAVGSEAAAASLTAGTEAAIAARGVGTLGQTARQGTLNYLTNPAAAEALGWGALYSTAYGQNYAGALQEADALEASDPERAARIRSMAQFSSLANAAIEIATEKIFPDESRVFRGRKFGLLEAALVPVKEGLEEGAGAIAQNTVGGVFETGRESEDPVAAAKAGFIAGAPFAGIAALSGRGATPQIENVPPPVAKEDVGAAVIDQVPADTPFEQVQAITDEITEGEQRLKEVMATPLPEEEAVDTSGGLEESSPAGQEASSEAPAEEVSEPPASESAAPGDPATSPVSPQEPDRQASGVVEDPVIEEEPEAPQESRSEPSSYIADVPAAQAVIDNVNAVKKTNLQIIPAPAGRLAKFAQQVASLSGRQVLYVKGKSQFDGVQSGNYLIVKPGGRQVLRKLIGHELGHSLEDLPGADKVFEALRNRNTARYDSYKAGLQRLNYTPEEIESEFFADSIGEAINDRAFWRSLTQSTDPTVLQRIADTLLAVVDQINRFWTEGVKSDFSRPVASRSIQDLENARNVIREFVKTAGTPQEGTIRESQQLPESSSRPTQEFSTRTGVHEIVTQEELHKVSDRIINPDKITEASYENLLTTLKSLRRSNGKTRTDIREAVRKQFGERIAKLPANRRETEEIILTAQAVQVLLGNAMAVGAEFNARPGKKNPKRAAVIASEVRKLAFENIISVPGDSHTAARILRSAQLQGGDLAGLMHDLRAAVVDYLKKQIGLDSQQITDLENAMEAARPEANKIAALKATREGENYLAAEKTQKGRVRTFAEKMTKWLLGRESRTVSQAESDLMAALSKLEEDYAVNIDLFEELAREAIEMLPAERREAALKELEQLVEFDIQLAEQLQELYQENRTLNRAAKTFIKRALEPATRKKSQATADFAAIREAVREGKLSPEEAVAQFIQEGGDPTLRNDLQAAFEQDATSTAQQDALKEDSKRARKEVKDFIKAGNVRARVESASTERQVSAVERARSRAMAAAQKAASDALIKEVGDEIAREEAFKKRLEQEAAAGDRAESQRLVKEVGAEIARAEDFQKRLNDQAKKAEADEKAAAEGIFKDRARKKGDKKITLTQHILDSIENNPEWDVSDHADKVEIIKDVLRKKGVSEDLLQETAEKAVKAFEDHLTKVAQKAGENLVKQLKRGKVTEAALFRAIRLNILDPTKSLTESLAALSGWKGLKPSEQAELYRITKQARNIKDEQVRLSLLLKQMRVIYAATGIPPDWRDFVSSYTRASAYSGLGTIYVNASVGLAAPAVNLIREGFKTFLTNPLHPLSAMGDTARALARAYRAAGKRGRLALRTNATLGLSAAKASGDKAQASTDPVGVLSVDALERRMDLAIKRIQDSSMPKWRKAWESYLIFASFTGKMLWRIIGAIDTVSTAQVTEFIAEMRLNRQLRRKGVDPVTEWSAFMTAHESGVRYAVEQLGLTPNQASIEMMFRLQDAYYTHLQDKTDDVRPFEYHGDARQEALTMIGNHAERQGFISKRGHEIADFFGHKDWMGFGFLFAGAPIRTIVNIAEYTSWYAPGLGLGKLLIEFVKRKAAKDGIGSYHLHAGSKWQFRRRAAESLFGQVLTGGLIALLAAQPDDDDEKWFGITTAYPWRPGDAVRFRNNKEQPYTMYFGAKKDGGRKYLQYTRGVLEMLAFPAIAAKNYDEYRRKKEEGIMSATYAVRDTVLMGLPVADSLARQWNLTQQGNSDRVYEFLGRKASILVPASSLARSVMKLTSDTPAKNSANYLTSVMLPGYAIFKDNGDVELRNALDEPIYADDSAWDTVNKMGLPFGFLPTSAPKDEVLAKDFSKMDYPIPPAPVFKTFTNRIEGREDELLKTNGIKDVNELYNKFVSDRAAVFKRIYREDPEPGDGAKDSRTAQERLKANDKEAFKDRLSKLWAMATAEVNKELGIVEEE